MLPCYQLGPCLTCASWWCLSASWGLGKMGKHQSTSWTPAQGALSEGRAWFDPSLAHTSGSSSWAGRQPIAALFTIAKTWKQPKCPFFMGLLNHKKEWHNAICSNMVGTRDSHSEWSMSGRERQIPYDITYFFNLIYVTHQPFHRKENHGLGEYACGCQSGRGGSGMHWELGVNRWKLLSLEWNGLAMRSLLCSTGNYV